MGRVSFGGSSTRVTGTPGPAANCVGAWLVTCERSVSSPAALFFRLGSVARVTVRGLPIRLIVEGTVHRPAVDVLAVPVNEGGVAPPVGVQGQAGGLVVGAPPL